PRTPRRRRPQKRPDRRVGPPPPRLHPPHGLLKTSDKPRHPQELPHAPFSGPACGAFLRPPPRQPNPPVKNKPTRTQRARVGIHFSFQYEPLEPTNSLLHVPNRHVARRPEQQHAVDVIHALLPLVIPVAIDLLIPLGRRVRRGRAEVIVEGVMLGTP